MKMNITFLFYLLCFLIINSITTKKLSLKKLELSKTNIKNLKKTSFGEKETVVIYINSGTTSCGFAGEKTPKAIFPTVVGRPRNQGFSLNPFSSPTFYFGKEVIDNIQYITLEYPLEKEVITNFSYVEQIIDYSFKKILQINPEEHKVIIAVNPLNPKSHNEKLTATLFEKFKVPAMYLLSNAELALFSTGRVNGIVLMMEEELTQAVPIYEGSVHSYAIINMKFGLKDLVKNLIKLLEENGYYVDDIYDENKVKEIIKKHAYISLDYEKEIATNFSSSLEVKIDTPLFKGDVVSVAQERFQVGEFLFQPSMMRIESTGIHESIYDSVMKCPSDIRELLYSNIVIAGEGSFFPNIKERLAKEVASLAPKGSEINVIAEENRTLAVFAGGSILCNVDYFQEIWIRKQDYERSGSAIVNSLLNNRLYEIEG